jgi:hypothetical protein
VYVNRLSNEEVADVAWHDVEVTAPDTSGSVEIEADGVKDSLNVEVAVDGYFVNWSEISQTKKVTYENISESSGAVNLNIVFKGNKEEYINIDLYNFARKYYIYIQSLENCETEGDLNGMNSGEFKIKPVDINKKSTINLNISGGLLADDGIADIYVKKIAKTITYTDTFGNSRQIESGASGFYTEDL